MNTLHLLIGLFNRRRVATWTFLLLLTITFLGSSHFTFASSSESSPASTMPLISEPKQILVLFSYHRAEWSDNVQKGIESVFTPYQNVNFFYEYMDTKRLKTKEYLETLRKIYIEKYAKALIDMVICVDNNALDLLAENARTLLPDTPVVFCGINDYSPALHAARPDVTGVVEYGDFSDTLKIAFRARPNAAKLYIICDHTETGETNTRDLIAALSTVAPGIQAVLMDRMSYEELFTTLQAADPQQVAFFVSFWKDGTGRNIEPWMLDAVFRKSAIPVFGRSEWMINHGMVGGKCVTGFAQGEAAARIALQILGGTPVSDLPVDTDSPNQYLFDHRMMQHFRIDEDIFPDKSIGFNRPEPFYRVSKTAGTNYLFFLLLLLTALVFLMLNIQQRRKAEKALLREKNIIDAILDSAPGMIYLYNDQGNLERWNKKHEEMSGYSSEEMNGRNVLDWFKGDDKSLSAVTDGLKNTFENGHGEAEADLQRKDGSTIPMYFTATPLTMNDKPYFVGIGIDITERKQAEDAKVKLEDQLQQAQKFEAIGTLAGGIAHDFNNLLMGIQGRVSLLSFDLEASNPHLEHINALEEYIRSATSLTRQLLGFARGGKYEVKPVDVNELLSSSSAMFGRTKKEIQIHTKCQTSALVVEADRGQIEQVLLNLYVNAWQAMPPDGGHLYLETKIVTLDEAICKPRQVDPGRYVKISITDTGTGMDEATRLRIFDPFFTTKEMGRGTGLGLASAYGIIKNHGGMITVYSEVGHGTTFNIYLPVSDKDAHREVPIEGGLIKGSATILLVDDEELIIDVGQAMLERLGYRVMVCRGGQEAVKEITDMGNEIDLVILDMVMPGMDGGTTFDQIRESQPDMPVILSSGYAINGQADKIMRRGCNGFIQKPYNISELSQKIRKVLDEPKCSTSE